MIIQGYITCNNNCLTFECSNCNNECYIKHIMTFNKSFCYMSLSGYNPNCDDDT